MGPARQGGLLPRRHRLLVRAGLKKGALTGPSPTDRAKAGSKHHLLVEGHGMPLTESVTAANVHDTHELFPLVDSVPAVRMPSGQRRFRPGKLHTDKAYASRKNRSGLRLRGIAARIARPGVESKERLGRYRWVVDVNGRGLPARAPTRHWPDGYAGAPPLPLAESGSARADAVEARGLITTNLVSQQSGAVQVSFSARTIGPSWGSLTPE
ncbi:transposase [Corallococcus sp. CA047B]|uniref:transposase n=1 Tax=Corallococcus sp. CA047B TaxID=2316729 RepID=UPI00351A9D0B